jgi:hypothetical protein
MVHVGILIHFLPSPSLVIPIQTFLSVVTKKKDILQLTRDLIPDSNKYCS